MTFKCIKCKKKWTVGPRTGTCSHGLCKTCGRIQMTDLIRRKQKRAGHFPCFATAGPYCDQSNCAYRKVCLKDEEEMKGNN